ncbi:MAG: ATP-grasp domain-containing protein [Planctomycetes bacterium]|nr:ATP-grasp domain-containing protein [Planctomycetota bacterium]NUQ35245.1 ATP-grasp domain-containing protein [Planctomycetaceae bacterium]
MLKKVLIANRAEIAGRIIRGCKKLGVKTVAVHSDVDARLPYVREADEAVYIGAAPAAKSYLRGDALIDAALEHGADGIHPGYGFLSENAAFARAVTASGITFIGPSADAMDRLGSKTAAKAVAEKAGVPVTPWFKVEGVDKALKQAAEVGFPVIVKPASGGGGKGMYRCDSADELRERIERAAREAKASFGDDTLLVEKFLVNPRHIEVQILGDNHGNVIHLFERECSIQRRNQKLIEESPSVALTPEQRRTVCDDAVRIAKAAGYSNAGTCEFLYDEAGKRWYFCEMNTRLQVEHPVTEMVTGVDLVEQQLRVASGEKLSLKQDSIKQTGHAIEMRIIAEDPFTGFTPSLGTLEHIEPPTGDGIRNEMGYQSGNEITPHYDSLLSKLIVHGKDRKQAVERSLAALDRFHAAGIQTCIPVHRAMLKDEGFLEGRFHIHYAEQRMKDGLCKREHQESAMLAAAALAFERDERMQSAGRTHLSAWASSSLPRAK